MIYRIGNFTLIEADSPAQAVERSGLPPARIVYGLLAVKLHEGPRMIRGLDLGCTIWQHRRLGVHAAINARSGERWRNEYRDGTHKIERRNVRLALAKIGFAGYRLHHTVRDSYGSRVRRSGETLATLSGETLSTLSDIIVPGGQL